MENLKGLSDLQLIELLKSSNPCAFKELFQRYKSILYSFSYYKINDKELAQDMIQTTFTDLWDNRVHINVPGKFESYIFTIVRNKILDHYRREQVTKRYLDNFQSYLDVNDNTTDHLVRHNELAKLIEIEIAALPDSLREAFLLSRNTSMTRKQIAEELKLSEEGVKTRMHRALKILKKRLGSNMSFL